MERKHQLEGEINVLAAEVRRTGIRGAPTGDLQARLERLRDQHYRIRLQIDRTDPLD